MVHPIYHLFIGGYQYPIDILDLLRLVLALLAVYYYRVFSKRVDAAFYQHGTRQLTFVFFALDATASFLVEIVPLPIVYLLREVGQFGVGLTIFSASGKMVESPAFAAVFVLPMLVRGIVNIGGLGIDVSSLVTIAFLFLAMRNYAVYNRTHAPSKLESSFRTLFMTALLASYVFQFMGVLLAQDMVVFIDLFQTLALVLGVYAVRAAAMAKVL